MDSGFPLRGPRNDGTEQTAEAECHHVTISTQRFSRLRDLLNVARHTVRASLLTFILLLAACGSGGGTSSGSGMTGDQADDGAGLPPIASLDGGVWMKGDLHLHSHHSDDAADNPLPELIAFAENVGMDYFIATDHDNHVDGDVAKHTWADPAYRSDSMLMLYGAEWTTHRGHGNTFSATPYDHQRFYEVRDERDSLIAERAHELGIHVSANHPSGADSFSFSYDFVKSIEVWNSSIWATNSGALLIWDDLLKSGRKLTGRGGSDAHHNVGADPSLWTSNVWQGLFNFVGTPTTWVYATQRSAEAVLAALDNGRVSVSATPAAERIEFYADLDADGSMDMMMGDIAEASGEPVNFQANIVGGPGLVPLYRITVTKDGAEFGVFNTAGRSLEFTDTPAPDVRSYYRVEVQGLPAPYPEVPLSSLTSTGMIGLSNPIYFNFDPAF